MIKRTLLLATALGCFGCQTANNDAAKAPANTMVIDSVTSEPDKWDVDVIRIGLGALSREELSSNPGMLLLSSKGSLDWQCRRIKEAFGAKLYNGRPLSKLFLLSGDDEKNFQDVVDCAFADQKYDLSGYKVVYVGPRSSFDFVVNKFKPTGIVVATKEYQAGKAL